MEYSNFVLAWMILSYFIAAAIGKVWKFNETVASFVQVTTPLLKPLLSKPPPISLYQSIISGVIVFQLLSSSVVLYAIYAPNGFLTTMAAYALWGLMAFTVAATVLYHLKLNQAQISKTLSNIAIVAALWLLNERIQKHQ